ncbi:hypothetical protein [Cellulomonas endophytica]|uniref:hypothetical protein n=1 Tax=Cellulomonas endophytica TaxID=2494735 RepID=UPI0010123225|nr:hypothetical protein [Cellulomonas endophytica]
MGAVPHEGVDGWVDELLAATRAPASAPHAARTGTTTGTAADVPDGPAPAPPPRSGHPDGSGLVPWHVLPEHRLDLDLALLHLEADRRHGAALAEDDVRRLEGWHRRLDRTDLVLDYDPTTDAGFRYVPRRPGVDLDVIREPGHHRPGTPAPDVDAALEAATMAFAVDEVIARALAGSPTGGTAAP